MKIVPALLFALLAACAPYRKPLGELSVAPVHELYPSMSVVHEAVFRLERGRLVAAGARSGADLDLVATEDGCLRGEAETKPVQICPAGQRPDDPEADSPSSWRAVTSDSVLAFSVELLQDGKALAVDAGAIHARIALPAGPAGDEVRDHPELLGAAFAFGLFPSSSDPLEEWTFRARPR